MWGDIAAITEDIGDVISEDTTPIVATIEGITGDMSDTTAIEGIIEDLTGDTEDELLRPNGS
jgi:hypothetical protein